MPCLCFPRRRDQDHFFHWPNFTFSHAQHNINPRRIHSTFSLHQKHNPRLILKRRHTLQSGTLVANLERSRKRRTSLKSTKTAPAVVNDFEEMREDYAPPPGPPPNHRLQSISPSAAQSQQQHVSWTGSGDRSSELASNNPFRNANTGASQGVVQSEPDLPPDYEQSSGRQTKQSSEKEDDPPPYDPWLQVPDNSILPPPPSIREEKSPTSNASWDDAARAHAWCDQHPIWPAGRLDGRTLTRISNGDLHLTLPPNVKHGKLSRTASGRTYITTPLKSKDVIFLSDIPIYSATSGQPRTTYYEVCILAMGSQSSWRSKEPEASIAIGFLAPPYPSWRQPGWHRASLAVHGDDGRRYIDNSFGGRDFVSAFKKGDVVGLGMAFSMSSYVGGKNNCRIFFTRNGKSEGEWDLHEEKDREQEDGEVHGLEGGHDLLAAVGSFGGVEFEVRFMRDDWLFKP